MGYGSSGIPMGYGSNGYIAQPVSFVQPQSVSGTILSASGPNVTLYTANRQLILVNDATAQFYAPVSIGQWVTVSGYNSGNEFVATSIS